MTLPNAPYNAREIIRAGSEQLGIPLTDLALERMLVHMRMIKEWNARANLTSVIDPREMAVRHYLDSLALLLVFPKIDRPRVLDIGTGAGFPGLVLASAVDRVKIALLDRDPLKIVFLKHATKHMSLDQVRFLNMAIGPLLHDADAYVSDLIVSRAFSSNAALMDNFHVLLKEGGYLARMTGPGTSVESLSLEHFEIVNTWEGTLPFSTRFRRVILYRKISYSGGVRETR
mgnify:CR=1 FL=1